MRILGLSAFYHDSAAALVEDGRVVAAAQEERFTRKKFDANFPKRALEYCLAEAGCGVGDIDYVVFYDKPFIKFERLLETYLTYSPRGFTSFRMALPLWLREKLFQKSLIAGELKALEPKFDWQKRLLFCEHHLSHAASAFYPSPFDRAAVLTLDGVGEWTTTAAAIGEGNNLAIHKEIHFPHSLGLLYSAFTYYTGFKVNSGEYKLMGLAPYGEPRYVQQIRDNLIDLKPDGSFRLNLDYFNYCTGLTMTNERFHALFGAPPRDPESLLTQKDMDLAASIQTVLEEVVLRLTRSLAADTGMENLCLAGGVALNCVANGKVLRDGEVSQHLDPAGGRRRRRRLGRGARRLLHARRQTAHRAERARRHVGRLSRAGIRPKRHRDAAAESRRAIQKRQHRGDGGDDGAGARRRQRGRLVPGPHGIRTARAGQPLDHRRPAQHGDAEEPQSEGQISRKLPAVRAVGAARPCGGMVRSRRRQPVHAAGCRRRLAAQTHR